MSPLPAISSLSDIMRLAETGRYRDIAFVAPRHVDVVHHLAQMPVLARPGWAYRAGRTETSNVVAGIRISGFSAEAPDRLRGPQFDLAIVHDYAHFPNRPEVRGLLSMCLAPRGSQIIYTGDVRNDDDDETVEAVVELASGVAIANLRPCSTVASSLVVGRTGRWWLIQDRNADGDPFCGGDPNVWSKTKLRRFDLRTPDGTRIVVPD